MNKDIAQFSIVGAAFAIAGDNATAADIMAIIASGAVREPSKGEGA